MVLGRQPVCNPFCAWLLFVVAVCMPLRYWPMRLCVRGLSTGHDCGQPWLFASQCASVFGVYLSGMTVANHGCLLGRNAMSNITC